MLHAQHKTTQGGCTHRGRVVVRASRNPPTPPKIWLHRWGYTSRTWLKPTTTQTLNLKPRAPDIAQVPKHEPKQQRKVGVHIADVSFFVRPGTALDQEASLSLSISRRSLFLSHTLYLSPSPQQRRMNSNVNARWECTSRTCRSSCARALDSKPSSPSFLSSEPSEQ